MSDSDKEPHSTKLFAKQPLGLKQKIIHFLTGFFGWFAGNAALLVFGYLVAPIFELAVGYGRIFTFGLYGFFVIFAYFIFFIMVPLNVLVFIFLLWYRRWIALGATLPFILVAFAIVTNLGPIFLRPSEYDQIIADSNRAIERDPNNAVAYYNRARAYNSIDRKRNSNQVVSDLTKAIELDPNYYEAYMERGFKYYEAGNYDQSIADFTRAIELRPNLAEPYASRGYAYRRKGLNDQAVADFQTCMKLYEFCLSFNRTSVEEWIRQVQSK